jgi:aspartyl-tRNA(Asn)/glutamyl-tRNA(Gln) amidotransferase subunit C
LEYIGQLKEVETGDVQATSHATGVKNVLREDKAKPSEEKLIAKLVVSAPEREKGYIKVKKVFE